MLPITVIVPTCNEAANLAGCLRSLRFCDQIIVVDSQSTDETAAIAGGVTGPRSISLIMQEGGRRSGSGRWGICQFGIPGRFWWMQTSG